MSTLTATQLQQQYIAYFGRPGDPAGIKYWLSSSSGISSAREFADKIYAQDEYKNSTVGTKSTEAQVNSLYQNLFGREADASGLIYWTGQIEAGTLTLSNIAYDLIAAASNPVSGNETQGAADALALSNKVAAATAFTADVEASTSAILAYQPETTTPWVTGAAFASGKSFLAGITSTAHTAAGIDSAVTTMVAANTTAGSTASGTTSKFTTGQDVLTGGDGNDVFNGVVIGASTTGTTAQPGDQISGGSGTDTLNISFSGTLTGDETLEAVDIDGVEKVLASNYETSSNANIISATLFDSSLSTVGLSSSASSGGTTFTNLSEIVDAEMRNGAGDLTLTYNAAVVAGSSDSQNLTISALTAGTFDADSVETLNLVSETSKSKLTDISSTGLKTLNISGSAALEVTTALATKTIDASASTGGVTLTLGSAIQTVTGGSGDDVISGAGTITKDDTIDGGAGADTLKLDIGNATFDGESDTTGQELYGVSGFETVQVASSHDSAVLELDTLWSGITDIAASALTSKTITATGATDDDGTKKIAFTLNGTAYETAEVDLTSTTAATDAGLTAAALKTSIDAISGFTATVASNVVTVTSTTTNVIQLAVTDADDQTYVVDGSDVKFSDAAGTETLTVYTGDLVTYALKDASGTADVAKIAIKPDPEFTADAKISQTVADIKVSDTESIELTVDGLNSDYTHTLSALSADASLTKLTLTGSSNFTLSDHASDNTKLATIDASAFTGDLTFSDTVASLAQTITTGSGNDTLTLTSGTLTEDDVIDLGGNTVLSTGKMGKDKVTHTGNLGSAVDDSVLQISNVETIELTAGAGSAQAMYIDASKMTGNGTVAFSGASGTVKIKNLDATTSIGLGIGTDDLSATVNLALADSSGTADSITLVESSTLNAASGITFKSSGIETLNITKTEDSTSAKTTTFSAWTDGAPSKIVVTKGDSGDTLALGSLNKGTTEVDASASKSITTLTGATDVAMTVSVAGSVANSVTTSTGNDTVTMGKAGTTTPTISLGTGTDTLNITLDNALSDFTNVAGVEVINLTIADSTATGFGDQTDDAGLNDTSVNTINILGGNSLSSFTVGGTDAEFDDLDHDFTIDASTFGGYIDIEFDEDGFDAEVSIKGGASTKDVVRLEGSDATDEKVALMTGVETLNVKTKTNTTAGVVDLSNVTGLTKLEVDFLTSTNADKITVNKVPAGVTVYVDSTATTDNLVLGLADAASATTSLTVEIDDVDAANSVVDLDITGIETLTIKQDDTGHTPNLNLAGVTATGTDGVTTLIVSGSSAKLAAINEDITTVDGTGMTGALTLLAADREANAMTITGGIGADSLTMEHKDDVIDGGLGSDTLTIEGHGTLGGFAVDLNSTTDQVSQYKGIANSAVQKGFEKVSGAAITGSFGMDVTGFDNTTTNDDITGSPFADNITGGKGDDALKGKEGADYLSGGAGTDTITGGAGGDRIYTGGNADIVVQTTASGQGSYSGDGFASDSSAWAFADAAAALALGIDVVYDFASTGQITLDDDLALADITNNQTGKAQAWAKDYAGTDYALADKKGAMFIHNTNDVILISNHSGASIIAFDQTQNGHEDNWMITGLHVTYLVGAKDITFTDASFI